MWTRRATDDAVGKIGVGAGLGGGWSIISWGSGDPWGTWAWAEFAQKKHGLGLKRGKLQRRKPYKIILYSNVKK